MQLSFDGIVPTEPPITRGSDWLKHPGLVLLMNKHALGGVKTLIVGPRASFEGKAHGYEGSSVWPTTGGTRSCGC